jgi:carboxypeptidase Q
MIKNDGIEVYTEPVRINKWRRIHESLELITPTLGRKPLEVTALGNTTSTPVDGITAEVVAVESFEELESLINKDKHAIKGKIVLFNHHWSSYGNGTRFRNLGAQKVEKHGGLASMISSVASYSLTTLHNGLQYYPSKIPAVAITTEDANLITRLYKRATGKLKSAVNNNKYRFKKPKVHLDIHVKGGMNNGKSKNVIAEIKGSEYPNEYVVLGGHVDSWDLGVGALDDGGGSFTSYEVLRQIKISGFKPKRTIRLVLWTGEENGGEGSDAYYNNHKHEIKDYALVMESDSDSAHPIGLRYSGPIASKEYLKKVGDQFLKPHGWGTEFFPGHGEADINLICKSGNIPCAGYKSGSKIKDIIKDTKCDEFIKDGYFWFHHTPADRMEVLKPELLAQSAATMLTYVLAASELEENLQKLQSTKFRVQSSIN